MTPQNQIVKRLFQHKHRIARMLSPGSRQVPASQGTWNYTLVASDFGARKFKLAASRMRVLRKEKLGSLQFENIQRSASAIQAKLPNAQKMLHLPAGGKPETGSWTEIEQVFPDQFSERVETPASDNELRQGSIIQKLSAFPQPGHRLESFKQQIQRNSMRQEPGFGAPEKRNLSPKDRLFTRVQELKIDRNENNIKRNEADKSTTDSSSEITQDIQRRTVSEKKPGQNKLSPISALHDMGIQEPLPASNLVPVPLRDETQRYIGQDLPHVYSSGIESKQPEGDQPVLDTAPASLPLAQPVKSIQRHGAAQLPGETTTTSQKSVPPEFGKTFPDAADSDFPLAQDDITTYSPTPGSPEEKKTTPSSFQNESSVLPPVEFVQRPLEQGSTVDARTGTGENAQPKMESTRTAQTSGAALSEKQPTDSALNGNKDVIRTGVDLPSGSVSSSITPVIQRKIDDRIQQESSITQKSDHHDVVHGIKALHEDNSGQPERNMPLIRHLQHRRSFVRGMRMNLEHDFPILSSNELGISTAMIQRRSIPLGKTTDSFQHTGYDRLQIPDPPADFAAPNASSTPATNRSSNLPDMQLVQRKITQPINNVRNREPAPLQSFQINQFTGSDTNLEFPPAKPVNDRQATQQFASPNIVQRVSDETQKTTPNLESQDRARTLNIRDLAEKIFPLVKQLFEIESERTGNLFR